MDEIPWERLFEVAHAARARAHAPYSHFPVGAAALYADGTIVPGCNVENSSYGLTLCAERNALARAVTDGHQGLQAVAIVVDTPSPCPPCGMCRQVMAEFAGADLPVRSRTLSGQEDRYRLGELLPHAFTRAFL
jgi:cytidine deaminase